MSFAFFCLKVARNSKYAKSHRFLIRFSASQVVVRTYLDERLEFNLTLTKQQGLIVVA